MSRRNQRGSGDALAVVIFGFIVAAVIAAVWFVAGTWNGYQCSRYGANTERETRYDRIAQVCYVKTKAGWRARGEQRTLDNELTE